MLIERTVIRNEARGIEIASLIDERLSSPRPPTGTAGGTAVTREGQQQWRDFVERFVEATRFDDPAQPPPRSGGLNWMRVPLPAPLSLSLWRSAPNNVAGGFVRFSGSEGLAIYDALVAASEEIDREFVEEGLPPPVWKRTGDDTSMTVSWPSPAPLSTAEEDRQIVLLGKAANRFVNSLRQRLALAA